MSQASRNRFAPVHRWLVAAVIAAGIFFIPLPTWVVDEFYSRDLFPWLQNGLTALSNMLPFAVLDLLIVAAVVLVLFRAVRLWLVLWQYGVLVALSELLRRVVRAVAVIVTLFMCTWGCNYRRVPLESTLGGRGATPSTVAALQSAVTDANALAAHLRPSLAREAAPSYPEIAALLRAPMDMALARLNREMLSRPGRPKFSVILTPFFTWAGVDGMINPLALESIVHPDLLPFERGFVLAHEWGHLAGLADEAEASAVGWFACMHGPPVLAYSASLYLILEATGSMPPDARRQAYSRLDAGVRADLAAIGERMRRQKPQVQHAASEVYDRYLKANRVPDGNASYTRALNLILTAPIRDSLTDYRDKAR